MLKGVYPPIDGYTNQERDEMAMKIDEVAKKTNV